MKKDKIRVVCVKPLEKPYSIMIDNNLKTLQKTVGGLIEYVPVDGYAFAVINENGKDTLMPNRIIADKNGNIIDYFPGTFYITGPTDEEGDNTSLTLEEAEHYIDMFSNTVLFTDYDITELYEV